MRQRQRDIMNETKGERYKEWQSKEFSKNIECARYRESNREGQECTADEGEVWKKEENRSEGLHWK